MKKFILEKGDYLDLSGESTKKRKEIYDWLVSQGSKFYSEFGYRFPFLEVSAISLSITQLKSSASLYPSSTNNRTEELLKAMKNENKGNILNAAEILVGRLVPLLSSNKVGSTEISSIIYEWDQNRGNDTFENYQRKEASPAKQRLPEEFIVVNADNMAVRGWLEGLGYKWCNGGGLIDYNNESSVLGLVYGRSGFTYGSIEQYKKNYPHIPIITPKLGIVGFDIEEPNANKSEIERMKKNIEELQESIAKLEGKE